MRRLDRESSVQVTLEESFAIRALREVAQWPNGRPPVIVFSGHEHAQENRLRVLRHGAHELAVSWGELFRVMQLYLYPN